MKIIAAIIISSMIIGMIVLGGYCIWLTFTTVFTSQFNKVLATITSFLSFFMGIFFIPAIPMIWRK